MAKKNEKNNSQVEEKIEEVAEETVETPEETTETPAEESNEEKLQKELDSMKDKLMRHVAEFDNFKKRSAKEREELYSMAVCDTVEKILPVKDNLERAIQAAENTEGQESMADGVKMILKQLEEVLASIGVEEIKAVGEVFDPEKHNAVMHEENEEFGENTVSEELMKGYTCKGKVIRYSMVKVAN